MTDILITFLTAQLAKEKGFKEMPFYIISSTEHVFGFIYDLFDEYDTPKETTFQFEDNVCSHLYLRSTQSLLQKWLREVHKIDIQIIRNKPGYDEYKVEIYQSFKDSNHYTFLQIKEEEYIKWFSKYEEALEIGLQEALKLI